MTDQDKTTTEEATQATAQTPATETKPEEAKVPVWVEQKGYKGETELVDQTLHAHAFTCSCGNVRWVAPGDLFQVDACKPCVHERRKAKRKAKAKAKRQAKAIEKARAVIAAAEATAAAA